MVRPEDTSADHVKACQELWDKSGGFYNAGPFTPFMFHEDGAPPKIDDSVSRRHRRRELGRAAADPSTGYVFVNAHDTSLVGWIEKSPARAELRPRHGRIEAALRSRQRERRRSVLHVQRADARTTRGRVVANLPCQRPPWAGSSPSTRTPATSRGRCRSASPTRCRKASSNTGGSGSAGPIVTAGGLVFVGATNDRRFRAFDSKTGKELWVAPAAGRTATRTRSRTPGKNGKQYVAIVATDSLQVFALP